ncbi:MULTISPECIES: TIGR03564 family F420-dependent LLM class oxidoreductase [Actinosynnema]|uniref:TIGR03564 family F420-dependent LLM class oxidoreductase n=1 Tax=Actinosynnema TaxID=40566 RepID=UPI0020A43C95|nr:TIGR03564 family F420-dependent LLM class oxidoreductase [Actinosynnema pretiosum]MCP2092243.1 F420-dependent oxidoreductase, MSMEG_4879 family [Actinosynnema pretiosum]
MKISTAIGDVRGTTAFDDLVDQAREAADAGLARAWISQATGWDALTAIAVAGAAAPGVELGTAVVPVPQRHPLVLAAQALTAQAATGGRLTLGIGAGIGMMVSGAFGLPTDHPVDRMREHLTALRPLLRGEPVEHRGKWITAAGAVAVPPTPAPPVLLAALGPRMVDLAGEAADGAITWMAGPRNLGEHIVPRLAAAAARAGRTAPRVVAGLPVCVTDHPDDARARVADRFGLAGQVPEYRAVLDREGAAGPADVALVGDEEAVTRALTRFRDAGATEFMAAPFGAPAERTRTTALLAHLG